MPAKITDAVRKKSIEKNKFFIKAILPFYRRDLKLTDPLLVKYFGKIEVQNEFIDYFKVIFSAKFCIILTKEKQLVKVRLSKQSLVISQEQSLGILFQHSIVFSNLTYQRVFSFITMTFEFSLLF